MDTLTDVYNKISKFVDDSAAQNANSNSSPPLNVAPPSSITYYLYTLIVLVVCVAAICTMILVMMQLLSKVGEGIGYVFRLAVKIFTYSLLIYISLIILSLLFQRSRVESIIVGIYRGIFTVTGGHKIQNSIELTWKQYVWNPDPYVPPYPELPAPTPKTTHTQTISQTSEPISSATTKPSTVHIVPPSVEAHEPTTHPPPEQQPHQHYAPNHHHARRRTRTDSTKKTNP